MHRNTYSDPIARAHGRSKEIAYKATCGQLISFRPPDLHSPSIHTTKIWTNFNTNVPEFSIRAAGPYISCIYQPDTLFETIAFEF